MGALTPLCSRRVLGCTPFIALAYFFLWFLTPFTSLRGLWYMTFYCLFQALGTVSRGPASWARPLGPHCSPGATLKCVWPEEVSGRVPLPALAHQTVSGDLPLASPTHPPTPLGSGLGATSCPSAPDSQFEGTSGDVAGWQGAWAVGLRRRAI